MIGFEDIILIFYIWVPNLIIAVVMKNNKFWTTFCYYSWTFDQENHGLRIPEHLFGPLYYACTPQSIPTKRKIIYLLHVGLESHTISKLELGLSDGSSPLKKLWLKSLSIIHANLTRNHNDIRCTYIILILEYKTQNWHVHLGQSYPLHFVATCEHCLLTLFYMP